MLFANERTHYSIRSCKGSYIFLFNNSSFDILLRKTRLTFKKSFTQNPETENLSQEFQKKHLKDTQAQ
ncbi:Uncharacterised protein [Porphyromonas macacae]|uniref:Uncharacterized protein n=1 Tax=Porphyromonas macacae TaxID=28115 RepID=A0A379DFB7_9PORP|nr:Uncharacterised protein [Porphyromonas macacae]